MQVTSLNIVFQKLMLKRRYIFRTHTSDEIDCSTLNFQDSYKLVIFKSIAEIENEAFQDNVKAFCKQKYGYEGANFRLNSKNWICFILIDKKTDEIAGISWLICPEGKPYWYDNVKFGGKESHLANIFILPKFRGNKLGQFLNHITFKYSFDIGYQSASAIVESYRKIAIHNQSKYSKKVAVNYLIKLLGINLFSVLYNGRNSVWYVGPGSRKKWKLIDK